MCDPPCQTITPTFEIVPEKTECSGPQNIPYLFHCGYLIVCLSMYSLFWYYFKRRGVRRISCLAFCESRENDSKKEKEKAILRPFLD